jgi:hypothetical protein
MVTSTSDKFHTGGCLCGSVRFQAVGRPMMVMVCHCTMCQRATGSAFSVEPVFLKERVELRGESLASYSHRSSDHGRLLHFSFCQTCGNRIGLTLERFPTVQIVYAGAFDDPTWIIPDSHIFTANAAPWSLFPSGVPCFAQHMFKADGTREAPVAGAS